MRAADLPLDERLANYIIEGTRDGLIVDLEKKRAEGTAPLDIVNGPLMAGMAEVGRLFNANELIVAEVLQSAEAMKAAVSHLEQFMEKADTAKRGKVVLATVKGDVHDIGKNLVEIILKNNGYDVVNLGIKVPPEDLIKAYQEHQPDAIGLSGLLVKSAQQMVITASDLKDAGIKVPLLVGGAALSAKFTQTKIAPSYGKAVCYAKDAMTGLQLDERADGSGDAGDGGAGAYVQRKRFWRDDDGERVGNSEGDAVAARTNGLADSARWRRWSARCGWCRICARCGVTSIRSCFTGGTWDSAAISKSALRSATRRRWNLFESMEEVKKEAAEFMKSARGVAIF